MSHQGAAADVHVLRKADASAGGEFQDLSSSGAGDIPSPVQLLLPIPVSSPWDMSVGAK